MPPKDTITNADLQDWLRQKLAVEIGVEPGLIDLNAPFAGHKLDSLTMISISYELEEYTGLVIDPAVFFEFDTPNKLIQWVQSQEK